jgi:hypothetical protein
MRHGTDATRVGLLLTAAFLIRLLFGLSSELFGPDESQIYLIGLQFFTTGAWPYFGPDVVYTHTQIPGALQGLLVGGPLFLLPIPEAPYIFLNLLSTASLWFFGWYVGRRLPEVPRWILWGWVFFAPWTLEMSTHVINQAYLLTGAIAFFVGAFELMPQLRVGALNRRLAGFLMGFGLMWVYQFHLSYSLLVPIASVVLILAARENFAGALEGLGFLALGTLLSGSTVIPTLLHVGPSAVAGSTASNVVFNPHNLLQLPQVAARFLSFASFEIVRFIGSDTSPRLEFLAAYPWAAPFVVVAAVIGVLQVFVLAAGFFWTRHPRKDWPAVKWFAIGILLLMYASFAFSVKNPASHTIYASLPVAMIYAFTCWAPLLSRPRVRQLAAVLFVCGAVTYLALGIRDFHLRSLYTNRATVVIAIDEKDYRIMGERRYR